MISLQRFNDSITSSFSFFHIEKYSIWLKSVFGKWELKKNIERQTTSTKPKHTFSGEQSNSTNKELVSSSHSIYHTKLVFLSHHDFSQTFKLHLFYRPGRKIFALFFKIIFYKDTEGFKKKNSTNKYLVTKPISKVQCPQSPSPSLSHPSECVKCAVNLSCCFNW